MGVKRSKRREKAARWPPRHWRRWLLALVLAPVLFLAVYAGVARWLLSGPALRAAINTNPEGFLLDYDGATSIWPGRVAIRNLRIRGSDHNAQWIVEVADATVEYSVTALVSRTFRCLHLRGSGLTFRVRNKLDAEAARGRKAALLPPILGFADPPLKPAAPPPPRAGKRHPWLVDVRSIWLDHFDEIWFDAFRFRGNARLRGQFLLRPGVLARIGPATIDVDHGDLRLGDAATGIAVSGGIAGAFAPFDVPSVSGNQVWEKVTGSVRIDGRFERLDAFEYLAGESGKTRFETGTGTLVIEGAISSGLARGSVKLDVDEGTARLNKVALAGDARLLVRIPNWNLVGGPLEISGSQLALTNVRTPGSPESRPWWGRFEIPSGTIAATSKARVEAHSRDARPLLAVLGAKLPAWTQGLLRLEDFSAVATIALGPTTTRIRGLDANGGGFHIQGDYSSDGPARRGAFLIQSEALGVGVELETEGTTLRLLGAQKWFEEQRKGREPAPGP
ncbi:MAG TPA: hypothetical protein VN032_00100 [Thermoanaerobaculia bacterium]|nr:hypothetical protein [Thermoanaerobaculia bacterium]